MILAAAIAITLSLTEPDPRLVEFQIGDILAAEIEKEEANDPSIWWRMTGWGVYLACGSIPASSMYRQDRSSWEPNGPNSAALSTAIFAPSALAANVLSEKARGGRHSDAAWAARLSMLGACVWTSGWNFNQGWRRQ